MIFMGKAHAIKIAMISTFNIHDVRNPPRSRGSLLSVLFRSFLITDRSKFLPPLSDYACRSNSICRGFLHEHHFFFRGFAPLLRLIIFLTPLELLARIFEPITFFLAESFPFNFPIFRIASSLPPVIARLIVPCLLPNINSTLDEITFFGFFSRFYDVS